MFIFESLYTSSWLSVNIPLYCELIYTTFSPYFWKFVDFCKNLEEYTRGYRHAAVDWVSNDQDKPIYAE